MLTIVIPTKNEEAFLPNLLSSLQRQTHQPQTVIVADADSTDRTREIARAFGAQVVGGGLPGKGRNVGAAIAQTPYVLFLDADVELTDDHALEDMMGEMLERDLDVATFDVEPLSGAAFVDRVMHAAYNRYARTLGLLFPHAPGFCILARRDLHEKIGGFDESVRFCEDHDYAHRAAEHGSLGFLSVRIPVSTRRFERDGRVAVAFKYALAELHLAILGPIRHEMFEYTFGHHPLPVHEEVDR